MGEKPTPEALAKMKQSFEAAQKAVKKKFKMTVIETHYKIVVDAPLSKEDFAPEKLTKE